MNPRKRPSPLQFFLVSCLLVLQGCPPADTEKAGTQGDSAVIEIPEYPDVTARLVDVGPLDFKIGILTGTVSQGEDEYRGAERVIARYGKEKIIHKTYPDNFMVEQETTVTQIMEMARDPDVKAVVIAQAVPGTLPAIKKARRERDDLVFILVSPQEDPEQIARDADLVLQTDDLMRGRTIIEQAKKMEAKCFVHYTFPRHMSMEILARRRDIMRTLCKQHGIEFVDANAPDPTGDQGIAGSQKFILEDVPRLIVEHGKDTAFFSTNCAMQEPLIRACLDGGAIFVEQCCPSPTHGYPGALGISITDDIAGDMAKIRGQISEKIRERGQTGRFGTWKVSMHIVMIEAAVELAKGSVHGKFALDDLGIVKGFLEKVGEVKVELGPFNRHQNFLMVISETVPL
ncbi:DUF3798 domain-containing protein [Planctomycetota bacterium]